MEELKFGKYYFNNENLEDITWLILKRDGDKILLVSKYILELKAYNEKLKPITWADSTLRAWLNNEFINIAFSSEENRLIQTVKNKNLDNEYTNANGGLATYDKIFILSNEEIYEYFPNSEDRKALASPRLESDEAYWWSRSVASIVGAKAYVGLDGEIHGCSISRDWVGVRPAMWLNQSGATNDFITNVKYIEFGLYYQNNEELEPISFRVLEEDENKILAVSQYGLDFQAYDLNGNIDFDSSTLKSWLNNDFKNTAFSNDEQAQIIDDIRILSHREIIDYFDDRPDRACTPTKYAKDSGAYIFKDNGSFYWTLTINEEENRPVFVLSDGAINDVGLPTSSKMVIRPVITIKK